MRRIFVSYSRQSEPAARQLVEHLETLGHEVWFDHELSGGQAWWDQILASIRGSEVFVLVLDTHSLGSSACQREWTYAAAVHRSILPVLAGDGVSINLLPPLLSRTQAVDYRDPTKAEAALRLARALGTLPAAAPLPDPLPTPPEVPMSYLGRIAERVDSAPSLTLEDQSVLLVELRRGLRDPALVADSRALLQRLRSRHDLMQAVAEDLDDLLRTAPAAATPVPTPAPAAASTPAVARATPPERRATLPDDPAADRRPDPAGARSPAPAPDLRPGAAVPRPVLSTPPTASGTPVDLPLHPPAASAVAAPADPAPPAEGRTRWARRLLPWAAGGGAIGVLSVLSFSGPLDGPEFLWALLPTSGAALGRLAARPTWRGTACIVVGAAIGAAVAAMLMGRHDAAPGAGLLGAPAGAVLLPLLERLLAPRGAGTQPA